MPDPTASRRLLYLTALGTIGITALLQLWRPFFHLTDDNLSAYLPTAVEFGRKLWSGSWPFVTDGSFGGNHRLLSDPGIFGLLSPWMFLFSWLSLTPFDYLLVDIVSLCNSLAIALSFCGSALWLRNHFGFQTPDWLIVALSLSYTFTPYNLLVGSSWIGFLNAQAGLPVVLVACFHRSHTRAVLMQTAALLYALFGGHAHIFIFLALFSGVLALGAAVQTRTWTPLLRACASAAMAALIASPVLFSTLQGFADSERAAGVQIAQASARRISAPVLLITMVFGPMATLASLMAGKYSDQAATTLSIGYSAINLLFLLAVTRFRSKVAGSNVILFCLACAVVFVVRPEWLGNVIAHIPLLKSLQWPFRETWIILFSLHVYVLFNASVVSPMVVRSLLAAGVLVVLGILLSPPPTFYEFAIDRRLVVNGVAKAYWERLGRDHGQRPRVVVGIDPHFMTIGRDEIPFALLGTYSFGAMYGFTSESGYTFTASLRDNAAADAPRPYYFSGSYTPDNARLIALRHPDTWLIELVGIKPAEWTIRSAGQLRRFRFDKVTGTVSELSPEVRRD